MADAEVVEVDLEGAGGPAGEDQAVARQCAGGAAAQADHAMFPYARAALGLGARGLGAPELIDALIAFEVELDRLVVVALERGIVETALQTVRGDCEVVLDVVGGEVRPLKAGEGNHEKILRPGLFRHGHGDFQDFAFGRGLGNAQISADPNSRSQNKITATETWDVIYDGSVSQLTAMTAAGLPIAGRVYNGLFCARVHPVRRNESPYAWKVQVDYENIVKDAEKKVWNLNIPKGSVMREETASRDRLNLPLVNTVGELLPQLPNITKVDETWMISWSTSEAPNWGEIDGKTNSDTITFTICGITRTFTKSQVKIMVSGFSSTKVIASTVDEVTTMFYIYDCELTIQVRKPKWVWSAPNEGFRGMLTVAGVNKIGTFSDGQDNMPRSSPTKIGFTGIALPAGATVLKIPDDMIGVPIPNGSRIYLSDGAFELEEQVSMADLFAAFDDTPLPPPPP